MKRSERPNTEECRHVWRPVAAHDKHFVCTVCSAGGFRKSRVHSIELYKCRCRHRDVYCNRPAFSSMGRCELHAALRPGEEE